MSTILFYYSYAGSTKRLALEKAAAENAEVFEVRDVKRPGMLKVVFAGIIGAIRGKSAKIEPINVDLSAYEKIVIMAPVWAGNPAPAINNVFDVLPSGKDVEIVMVSQSGGSSCRERLAKIVDEKGCRLAAFTDVKA